MEQYGFSSELNYALNTLTSPVGIVAIVFFLTFLVLALMNPTIKWLTIALMIWISSVAFFIDAKGHLPTPLSFPLQSIVSEARPLTTALLLILLPAALFAPRGWRRQLIGLPAILLLVFQVILSIRIWFAGIEDRGAVSFGIFVLMFFALSLGCAKWLQTWDDANKLFRCIVCAGAVNTIASLYQLAMNRSVSLSGYRLMGVNGNPQHLAVMSALALPPAFYLLGRAAEPKSWRVFSGIVAGFLSMMLLWTGSRTGMLMAAVGVTVIFWARLGRLAAVVIVTGLVALIAIQFYQESTMTIGDLMLRGDTRTRVWRGLWEGFLANPAAGTMEAGYGTGENSYLTIASQMGLLGLIPFALFLAATIAGFFKLLRWRLALGDERQVADVVMGGILSILIGGIFEGYLLGSIVPAVLTLLIYLAMMTFVIDAAKMNWEQSQLVGMETGVGVGDIRYEYAPAVDYQPVGPTF